MDNQNGYNSINGTVLIVNEQIDVSIVLSGVFGLNGFNCIKCHSAEEATKILEEKSEEIDVMLLDGKIAEDRGAMLIVKSKTKNHKIKIVVVASHDNAKTRVLDYGADDFVVKPISAESITNRVITQLVKR